ncbi:hypothetical protein BDB00DRAFT_29073 [Zychaea mexicana]|uniref:uncharacterized protein n=1 Tax=Zychaea mexicana TaxID=64656 RepID=UPI0022FE08FF|nr:uncharacterized protein BDB00DRAFT_29073 [Zychaea mexicana]KAI9488752.1 hypothetical protein BDB00DRAFT_29073 [Zychaea mexicana]
MNKEAFVTQLSFHFSPASAHILPLQDIRQRLRGIWDSLTWPVIKRILKADLAVTLIFALLFVEPVRQYTEYGLILAQVAVEFIHPAKSYGSVGEDIVFGSIMCSVSAAWSLLGTYCASLLRDPSNPEMAQPRVAGVLVAFLLVGAFVLNYCRVKIDQCNVGGMLSATILVISLTTAIVDRQWQPWHVLQNFFSILSGLVIVFIICIVVWPENSTKIYVQQLVKTLETFDSIAQRQVDGFLHINATPREQYIYPSRSSHSAPPEPLAAVHRSIDQHLLSLVQIKRVVRREASFNYMAPRDVSDMTRLVKKMRVPLQGVSMSRTMEENMRKAQTRRHIANRLKKFAAQDNLDPIKTPQQERMSYSGQSFTTMGSDNAANDSGDEGPCWDNNGSCDSSSSSSSSSDSSDDDDDHDDDHDADYDEKKDHAPAAQRSGRTTTSSDMPGRPSTSTAATLHNGTINGGDGVRKYSEDGGIAGSGIDIDSGNNTPDHQHITISVPEDEATFTGSTWRREYDDVIKTVRPIYSELSQACSTAIHESTQRLYRMQHIDPRYQNKPFLYRLFACDKTTPGSVSDMDPSVPLIRAIQKFDAHRLRGLERLYHNNNGHGEQQPIPRRILFLLLHFQFNLRGYAERVYTLSSLIYEMDQARKRRRMWLPHLSVRKWFRHRNSEADVGLDPPAAVVAENNLHHPSVAGGLQRSLSRRTTTILNTMTIDALVAEQEQQHEADVEEERAGHLAIPVRGKLSHSKRKRKSSAAAAVATMAALDNQALDPAMYHDPDVAYPTTRIQRTFFKWWMFYKNFICSADTVFALRACIVVMALTLPGFVEESIDWYLRARGQWAAVVALVWMGPSVGSNFFGLMVRTVGTFVGAICSLLIWEISQTNRAAMIILVFLFNLPWWLIYLNGKFWKATGLFSLITTSIIVGYAHNYRMSGRDISVFEVTYERTVAVLAGVVAALVISIFPYPRTGRVELRHRISRTLGDAAALYSSFLALLLKNGYHETEIRMSNRKVFRTVAAEIRKQIKGQRVLLEQSRFEPALRGVFQEHKYIQILQVLDNLVNLMIEMENALERIHESWRIELVRDTWKERKNAIASFLTALYVGANALSNKTPLPPYVLRPTRARRILTNKARLIPNLLPERLADPEYTYYSAYLMCSEQLAVEIELLISTIRDLVGPDSVSVWLDYRH